MIREAIILAGGLGTRLRSAVPDLPKCMAPVAGKPFINYVIDYYVDQGIERFIFSLGYKHEIITAYLGKSFPELEYRKSIEDEPLGTGGAIRQSLHQAGTDEVLIVNGDTLFETDLGRLSLFHKDKAATCTLALKPMTNSDRYGVVELDADQRIASFKEKNYYRNSLINGGVYLLDRAAFLKENLPLKFSFEKDYLEKYFPQRRMYGCVQEGYFIDIGVPEDYNKANKDFENARPQQSR